MQITVLLGDFPAMTRRRVVDAFVQQSRMRLAALDSSGLGRASSSAVALVGESTEHAQLTLLKGGKPPLGVVVLAERPTSLLGTMLLAGGVSCIPCDVAVPDLLATVRVAAEGDCLFRSVAGQVTGRRDLHRLRTLTPREREVLASLRTKKKAAEIAYTLEISVETVRTHLASIRRKLGAKTNRELEGLDSWPPL